MQIVMDIFIRAFHSTFCPEK